jgi:hypothetical protein
MYRNLYKKDKQNKNNYNFSVRGAAKVKCVIMQEEPKRVMFEKY